MLEEVVEEEHIVMQGVEEQQVGTIFLCAALLQRWILVPWLGKTRDTSSPSFFCSRTYIGTICVMDLVGFLMV